MSISPRDIFDTLEEIEDDLEQEGYFPILDDQGERPHCHPWAKLLDGAIAGVTGFGTEGEGGATGSSGNSGADSIQVQTLLDLFEKRICFSTMVNVPFLRRLELLQIVFVAKLCTNYCTKECQIAHWKGGHKLK